ncbi:MAG: HAD-IIIA family hydrolase [bacterium]|nr:HAD-IIIA family hydrolase [bacterium]
MHRYKPDLYCADITDVPFANLAAKNIVNICVDLDNTLARRDSAVVEARLAKALEQAQRDNYIKNICVVSNIIWGSGRAERVRRIAEQLRTQHYFAARFWERKPSAIPFLEAMRMMHSTPQTTAIIGDQVFTDILGGNRLGMYTILVRPLGPDHWTTLLTGRRLREAALLARLGLKK